MILDDSKTTTATTATTTTTTRTRYYSSAIYFCFEYSLRPISSRRYVRPGISSHKFLWFASILPRIWMNFNQNENTHTHTHTHTHTYKNNNNKKKDIFEIRNCKKKERNSRFQNRPLKIIRTAQLRWFLLVPPLSVPSSALAPPPYLLDSSPWYSQYSASRLLKSVPFFRQKKTNIVSWFLFDYNYNFKSLRITTKKNKQFLVWIFDIFFFCLHFVFVLKRHWKRERERWKEKKKKNNKKNWMKNFFFCRFSRLGGEHNIHQLSVTSRPVPIL